MLIFCPQCGVRCEKPTGAVNRARGIGAPIYCDRACAGLARRKHKSKAQKRAEKREYDAQYREVNLQRLKAAKAEYYRRTYSPEAGRAFRAKRKADGYDHTEYCRSPGQVAKRKTRDRARYASEFGDYADCHTLLMDINREVKERITDYEIRKQNGTLNKIQERKRDYARHTGRDKNSHGHVAQGGAMGHAQRRQE